MTKPCVYPGCDQPRKLTKSGKPLTLCAEHFSEYGRRQYTNSWDGWLAERRDKTPKEKTPRTPKRTKRAPNAPALPEPQVAPPVAVRVIALRCDLCKVKLPYTDEHFDISGQARTCRHCAEAQIITVVNPVDNTARRGRLLIGDEVFSCGEGDEAYAAFARAERRDGRMVVIAW